MQARERALLGLACALATLIAFASIPALAAATVRFASPTGPASGTCTSVEPPCDLQHAVEVVAVAGDEVIVGGGTYNEATDPLEIGPSVYVHGADGQPHPQINFTDPPGFFSSTVVSDNSVLGRVSIRQTLGDAADGALLVDGGTAEQVLVDGGPSFGCQVFPPGGVLRDSVCWASSGNGIDVAAVGDGAAPDETVAATLRNVTAVGATRGILAQASGGAIASVDAKNVIVDGTTDIEASEGAADTTTVSLESSNYLATATSGAGTPTITAPGSGTNQTASPHFANAAAGNFHQLASSPTVDAGGNFFLMGSLDIDGGSRSVDGSASCTGSVARPDIGADEFVPGALDCLAPETGINDGPKAKTRKRRAGFNFVATEISTFQCSIDEKPFVPCVPPQAYRKLKPGKHEFNVRAVDGAGNIDTSPAERTWRILKNKKKKRRR